MEHPQITRVNRTGYPHPMNHYHKWTPPKLTRNACGCGYESVVIFDGHPLCGKCAAEERIVVI